MFDKGSSKFNYCYKKTYLVDKYESASPQTIKYVFKFIDFGSKSVVFYFYDQAFLFLNFEQFISSFFYSAQKQSFNRLSGCQKTLQSLQTPNESH